MSAAIVSFPFLPISCPCNLTHVSLFFTSNFTAFPTSSSLDITLLAVDDVANLISSFSSLFFSSNNGDRSNPSDRDIMWNAFNVSAGGFDFVKFSSVCSCSSFVIRLFGTDFLNQDEDVIFVIPALVTGFGSSSFVMSRRASGENHDGHLKSPL
uniref:Uncharacterized protein n=1 Tax=Cucumis sativus TaxID=3659 RepID=A0A0A0LJ60_CUCSA